VVEAYTRPNANGLPVTNGQYGPVGQNSRLLAIDPQGQFLYSISSSSHTISAFKINTDGKLGVAMGPYDASSGTIRYPQEIVVDPTGHFVYALILDGNSPYTGAVCIYRIDQSTGALTLTSIDTSVGNYPQAMAVGSLP
jgi:6-phosphogluconolactonase (cycloisomerase 2 family)